MFMCRRFRLRNITKRRGWIGSMFRGLRIGWGVREGAGWGRRMGWRCPGLGLFSILSFIRLICGRSLRNSFLPLFMLFLSKIGKFDNFNSFLSIFFIYFFLFFHFFLIISSWILRKSKWKRQKFNRYKE